MNKQEIFPLYVGKCKVKYAGGEYLLMGIELPLGFYFEDRDTDSVQSGLISDCQLILKKLSSMSEGDNPEFDLLLPRVSLAGTTYQRIKAMNNLTRWLIQHGYALDDLWFEGKNPIAVEK